MTSHTPVALLLLALCLPPGVPDLTSMTRIDHRVFAMEGQRPTETFMVVNVLYRASDGAHYGIVRMLGAVAIVDDEPMNSEATHWWIDPGLVTDDVPAKAQAVPASTCQWRRRGEAA